MSKKISTFGKVWLIFLAVVSVAGVVSNLMAVGDGVIYIVSAIACAGQLFGLFYLLQGKGINYLYVYSGCYLLNGVLGLTVRDDVTVSFIIGFVLGLAINIGLTYLASKDTFKD